MEVQVLPGKPYQDPPRDNNRRRRLAFHRSPKRPRYYHKGSPDYPHHERTRTGRSRSPKQHHNSDLRSNKHRRSRSPISPIRKPYKLSDSNNHTYRNSKDIKRPSKRSSHSHLRHPIREKRFSCSPNSLHPPPDTTVAPPTQTQFHQDASNIPKIAPTKELPPPPVFEPTPAKNQLPNATSTPAINPESQPTPNQTELNSSPEKVPNLKITFRPDRSISPAPQSSTPTTPLLEIPELMSDFDEIYLDHQKQTHLMYHLLQATKSINRSVYLGFAELLKAEGFIKQDK